MYLICKVNVFPFCPFFFPRWQGFIQVLGCPTYCNLGFRELNRRNWDTGRRTCSTPSPTRGFRSSSGSGYRVVWVSRAPNFRTRRSRGSDCNVWPSSYQDPRTTVRVRVMRWSVTWAYLTDVTETRTLFRDGPRSPTGFVGNFRSTSGKNWGIGWVRHVDVLIMVWCLRHSFTYFIRKISTRSSQSSYGTTLFKYIRVTFVLYSHNEVST